MRAFSALICAAALCVVAPALAQTSPEQGGEEIWDISTAGTPRHWHTGLTCWPVAGDTPFVRRIAYNPTGSDVSCSYGDPNALITLYVTRQDQERPLDAAIADGRRQVIDRYRGARTTADGRRIIQTSSGALPVDELILSIDGDDIRQNTHMRGATGVWQADVGGWTLKLRLSNYRPGSAGSLHTLAETLLGRAYADMQIARACATAGREQAPNLGLTGDEGVQVQVSAAAMMLAVAAAIPDTPLEARRAGFVCLGETSVSEDGVAMAGVFPAQGSATDGDVELLGIGEIRPMEGRPTMVALVDMSMNPFGVENARTDHGHFMFAVNDDTTYFFGVLNGGELRHTLAWSAAHVHRGAAPLVTSSPPGEPSTPAN